MPWKAFEKNDEWCVYRIDENGNAVGETLGCHDSKEKAERQVAALYASEPEAQSKAVTKRESDGDHPASHYLVAEDPKSPSTWHLRVRDASGKLDHRLMGAAWAALHGGYRGNRYEGPNKREAISKLRALYEREDIPIPGGKALTVKSTDNGYTLGGWGVVYGSVDLEGERFVPETDFWFDKLTRTPPVLYQHGMDAKAARQVLGKAAVDERDIGVWVETQIALSNEYAEAIRQLAEEGRLGWSSGAVGHLVERDGATITSWPIAEFSLTPTPAEPRTLGVSELRVLAASEPAVKAILPEGDGKSPADATTAKQAAQSINVTDRTQEIEMVDKGNNSTEAQEQKTLDPAVFAEAAMNKFRALLENEPALRRAFYDTPTDKDHPEVKSLGNWLLAVQNGDEKRLKSVYGSRKDLAEGVGSSGGYLVPPEYSQDILRLATERSVVRPRARVIPMRGREWNVPSLDYTGSTAGKPPQLAGVVATWTEEGGEKTETEPTFRTIKLMYHELSGYTQATNMLRQDAGPTLESTLRELFADAVSWYEDWAFLRGDGAGKPLGVFNANCLLSEAAGASTCVLSDLANMMTKFLNRPNDVGPYGGAVWVMHPESPISLRSLMARRTRITSSGFRAQARNNRRPCSASRSSGQKKCREFRRRPRPRTRGASCLLISATT